MNLPSPVDDMPLDTRTRTLRLGLYAPACLPGYQLPYYAAAADGEFTDYGLEVELSDPEGGLGPLWALREGRLDACITSVSHYLRAVQEGPDLPARFCLMIARRTHLAAFVLDRGDESHDPFMPFQELRGLA